MNSCLSGPSSDNRLAVNSVRILLLVRSLDAGGAERQLVYLAGEMQERGHKVAVGTFYRSGILARELESRGIEIIDLAKRGRWDVFGFMWRTVLLMRAFRPDVIYSFLGGANIVAAVARTLVSGAKLVWSVRSSNVDLKRYDWLHRASYAIESCMSGAPDLIIANSFAGRDFAVANGFPPGRIVVVPNGIDTERFRPHPRLRAAERRRLQLSEGEIAVGVLARLDPMKGHAILVNAAAEIGDRDPPLRFVFFGEGPEEPRLRMLAYHTLPHARVQFSGATASPEIALNALDICCSPSLFGEGFSNSIAEAMACGLPCVVTDVGDSAAIVRRYGVVVPPGDPHALANAILHLAARLDSFDTAAVRARIVENFSITAMADRTLKLFERLMVR